MILGYQQIHSLAQHQPTVIHQVLDRYSHKSMTFTRITIEDLRQLTKLPKKEISNQKGKVKIHMDNASSHTAKLTKNFLTKSPFTQIRHPANSTDLSLSDYYLFGVLKNKLKVNQAKSVEEPKEIVAQALKQFRSSDLKKALDG
ncbi:MAG: hypothetical protein EZS28_052893 [Streblomastix strix]|uniref:Tc1-like transposase DDE domain-containing protein n=1 Tax=Streblomastix strix TaxID=222440 RepID=A0A5J4RRD8_9EUKA|nr:MAG: hypothetical protein EZS28_052893 [Streblomastix strix]